jgi:hypothetical protein
VFIDIIHAACQPAFVIGSQAQIVPGSLSGISTGLFSYQVDINIIEIVFIIMAENQEKLVGG